jgi:DNA-binding NarL/FixJ family response regulator
MPEKMIAPQDRFFSPRNQIETIDQISVGIVASHSLVSHYLCDLIKSNNMMPVLLADGTKSGAVFPSHTNTVVLIDLCGLPLPTSEYLNHFRAVISNCSFLALDRGRNEVEVAGFLRAGFSGFISHDDVLCLLGPAINAIAEGRIWTSPEVIRIYMNLTSKLIPALTLREHQVVELLRRRYSNKEMASLLRISESTVKFHVSNVLMKLNVSDRRDLTKTESGIRHSALFPAIFPEKFGTPGPSAITVSAASDRSYKIRNGLIKNAKTGS